MSNLTNQPAVEKLADLSKIHFDAPSLAQMEQDMMSIMSLMDTIKIIKLPEEFSPADSASLTDLRLDEASACGGILKKPTFTIPRIIE